MTGNAELQTSVFLKDSIFEWHVLKLVWLGRPRQGYSFWGIFKVSGTYAERLMLSLSQVPGVEKLLSWYGGSSYGTLKPAASSRPLGFWSSDGLGLWPCSLHGRECT